MSRLTFLLWTCGVSAVMLNLSVSAAQSPMTVYTVDGLTRVHPTDAPRSAQSVHIKAARNEYEPFQVVVRAGDEGLQGVTVRVSDLRLARSWTEWETDASRLLAAREEMAKRMVGQRGK